jgi:hypothetical protein
VKSATGAVKTKVTIAVVKRLINALDRAVEAQEALALATVENTKTLQRIEALLDEQADLQADTRDAVVELPQVLEVKPKKGKS